MTGRIGPRLSALLSDLGIGHSADPDPGVRSNPLPGARATDPSSVVRVIARLVTPGTEGLDTVGLLRARGSGTVVTGSVRLATVPGVAEHPRIASLELEEQSLPELHSSVPATHADVVRTGPLGLNGSGVIVGIIDSGIDIFHHAFRTADGSTRILGLRDFTAPYTIEAVGTPTGGTFSLSWVPPKGKPGAGVTQTTSTVPFNGTAAQVTTALETIPAIQPGDVVVTGGPLPGDDIVVAFAGRYLRKDVAYVELAISAVTPAAAEVIVTAGHTYSEDDINEALDGAPADFGSWDSNGHGTHVAGIAAGDGSQAGNCHLADYYVGVAPEADLVIVKHDYDSHAIDGLDYIFDLAGTNDQAAVVNMSFGGRSGARDGSTDLEQKIDELLAADPTDFPPGRVIVKSAGNSGALHDWDAPNPQSFRPGSSGHSLKTVPANGTTTMTVLVRPGDKKDDWFDFWYEGAGRLSITVKAPRDAATTATVAPDDAVQNTTLHRHPIRVLSRTAASSTGRHNISVRVSGRPNGQVRTGEWVFTLTETAGTATEVHCWIQLEKTDPHPRFVKADHVQTATLTPPGTAHRAIVVANYDHRDSTLAESSSRGPTIDSRSDYETKPDIAAPGTGILAAKSGGKNDGICCDCCSYDFYTSKSGTSMAAPHVTGIVALMLEGDETLTWEQVRKHLRDSFDPPDPITEPTLPNHDWGAGVVNADAAVTAALETVSASWTPVAGTGTAISARTPALVPALAAQITPGSATAASFEELRRTLLGTPAGRLGYALVSTHLSEARRLVDHERRVTVAWHRMGGPALVAAVVAGVEGTPVRIPEQVDGRDVRAGLERFLDALTEAGSLPLRQDVERHRALLLSLPGLDLAGLETIDAAG